MGPKRFPYICLPHPLQTNELLGRVAIALPGFGINVTFELWSCSYYDVVLIIVHDKIIMLIRTWSLTWDNSATTSVVWATLGWLFRKASGGLPYPQGAMAVEELRYREVLRSIMLSWLYEWGIPILPFSDVTPQVLPKALTPYLHLWLVSHVFKWRRRSTKTLETMGLTKEGSWQKHYPNILCNGHLGQKRIKP
jgi:hypothetical protein